MTIHKCDICGREFRSSLDNIIFTSVKRRYWVFTSCKEEILDICNDCQRDLRTVLDKKVRKEE